MILATVITCPQRWPEYRRLTQQFAALKFGFPLRTFQTSEHLESAYINNNTNARAALAYGLAHLPENGWLLYLEDDVVLSSELPRLLPDLVRIGNEQQLDLWYLCNRKNAFVSQRIIGCASGAALAAAELSYPAFGAHGLLIPYRHLKPLLSGHWSRVSDESMFEILQRGSWSVWQVVDPVLVEHVGEVSTYNPTARKKLEVNTLCV